MESFTVEMSYLTDFGVKFHFAFSQITLRETFIRCNGVDFAVAVFAGDAAQVPVRLSVEEVEGLLTATRHAWDAVAVSQGELQLDEDALAALPPYPPRLEPVVLTGLHHVAYLICTNGLVFLINTADFLPLKWEEREEKKRFQMKKCLSKNHGL